MINKSYYKPLEDYFEQLANSSKFIGNFVPMSEGAMDDVLAKSTVKFPLLCLVDYEGKLNQNKQRTIATRTVTFAVLFSCNTDDLHGQRQRVHDAESVGLNILAKIEYDACSGNVPFLKNAFKKETVHFRNVEYMEHANLYGEEFSFDLEIKNPLNYSVDFWTK
ncbi:hypothetical protein QP519_03065 [Weeksella virosa]|uniref:hypothetical protein n=1 Tax=Weeksella virosa TaxID=1014 RepID=UPI0025536D50|nr:hypothetical protein [Weeksella virosa]MDK7374517.1 hypothetical protein [Weeksella virosa]